MTKADDIHGAIVHPDTGRKDSLIRVAVKAVIEGDFEYEILIAEDPRLIKTVNMYQMRITFLVKPSSMTFKPGIDGDEVQFVDADEYENSELWTERQIFMFSSLAKNRLASL